MKIRTTYKAKIKEYSHVFDDTLTVYRNALDYLIAVCLEHWDEVITIDGNLNRQKYVENLVHNTKSNKAVYDFDTRFYKFPCYLMRAAITDAIGKVSSYKSNLANWNGREPSIPKAGRSFPMLYRGNCYRKTANKYICEIKVFIHNTWDWVQVDLRKSDVDYIQKHCSTRKQQAPKLVKHGKRYALAFPFEEETKLVDNVQTIVAVDLGVNNACVCSVMQSDDTILGRHFLKLSREQDSLIHSLNKIKQAQQRGNRKMLRLWAKAKGINNDIAVKTAQFITDIAAYYNTDCIVFEHLDLQKKKHGSKKQRLHMWKAQTVQRIVTDKAHRMGMRISHVCAWGTSKFAYDGSGIVTRDRNNYSMCTFPNGKRYHADLSASYNIGARYFIREITKSLSETIRLACETKVSRIAKRSTCTYSDLISLNAELMRLAA